MLFPRGSFFFYSLSRQKLGQTFNSFARKRESPLLLGPSTDGKYRIKRYQRHLSSFFRCHKSLTHTALIQFSRAKNVIFCTPLLLPPPPPFFLQRSILPEYGDRECRKSRIWESDVRCWQLEAGLHYLYFRPLLPPRKTYITLLLELFKSAEKEIYRRGVCRGRSNAASVASEQGTRQQGLARSRARRRKHEIYYKTNNCKGSFKNKRYVIP